MKTCPLCLNIDLDDAAQKCPHCGGWQSRWKRLVDTGGKIVAAILIVLFLIALPSCAGIALLEYF